MEENYWFPIFGLNDWEGFGCKWKGRKYLSTRILIDLMLLPIPQTYYNQTTETLVHFFSLLFVSFDFSYFLIFTKHSSHLLNQISCYLVKYYINPFSNDDDGSNLLLRFWINLSVFAIISNFISLSEVWSFIRDTLCALVQIVWEVTLKYCYNLCNYLGHVRDDEKDSIPSLNDDGILNILARLPAEDLLRDKLVCLHWQQLICSKHFIDAHLEKTKTSSMVKFIMFDRVYLNDKREESTIFRIDFQNKTIELYKMSSEATKLLPSESMMLRASCNGLVVLRCDASSFMVSNFLTREFVMVPIVGKDVCGFIFDKSMDEYKFILYTVRDEHALYFLYGLRSRIIESLGTFQYWPTVFYSSLYLSEAAYWIVSNAETHLQLMMFDFDNKSINVKSLPGVQRCNTSIELIRRRLLNVNGNVAYVEFYDDIIRLWTLEDITTSLWVKSNVINLSAEFRRYPYLSHVRYDHCVDVLDIQDGELFLKWPFKGLFWYNLRSKKIRKVKTGSLITNVMLQSMANGISCLRSLVSPKQAIEDLHQI